MSIKRTNTGVVQTRIDIRILAGLAKYANSQGRSPKKTPGFRKANLVQSSLELLHDTLSLNGLLKSFDSTADALAYLEELEYGMENAVNPKKLKAAIDAESFRTIELLKKPGVSEAARSILSESD